MAISVTDLGVANSTSGATVTFTLTGLSVPSGAVIVVCVTDKSAVAPGGSVGDTKNTYGVAIGANMNNSTANGFHRVFYAWNATALTSTDVITYNKVTSGAQAAISCFYVTGLETASDPLDKAVIATGSSSTPSSGSSGTPAKANGLVIGSLGEGGANRAFTQDSTNGAYATPPTQSQSGTQTTSARVNGGHFTASDGLAHTFAPTLNGIVSWACAVLIFKLFDPNVTVSITGVAATGDVGTMVAENDAALTGNAATGDVGSVSPVNSPTLTGVAATGSPGSLAVGERSFALTGVQGAGSPGTLSPAFSFALTGLEGDTALGSILPVLAPILTGIEATGSPGSLAVGERSLGLVGVQGAGSPGSLAPEFDFTLDGLEATGDVGTIIPEMGTALTGVAAAGDIGAIVGSLSVSVSGLQATGDVGILTPVSGTLIEIMLTGIQGAADIGTLTPEFDIAIEGIEATGELGDMFGAWSVALEGVEGTGFLGSATASFGITLHGIVASGRLGFFKFRLPTSVSRVYTVLAELRTVSVAREHRAATIAPQFRTALIASEHRVAVVSPEFRTHEALSNDR